MTSSGTRDPWRPVTFPADPEAARLLREWLSDRTQTLDLTYTDLRGADLSGGDLYSGWFSAADLRGVNLRATTLGAAQFGAARLERADLSDCTMVEAEFNETDLRWARFDRVEMHETKFFGCDARQASFRSCTMITTLIGDIDARGADFRDASIHKCRLRLQVDESTILSGMRGDFNGTFLLHGAAAPYELTGDELQQWLRARGADIEVIPPRRPLNPPIPWKTRPDTTSHP